MFPNAVTLSDGQACQQLVLDNYFLDFIPGDGRLFITFETAGGPPARPDGLRPSWGARFLSGKGYSVLGVKPKRIDWYRGADLHAFFRSQEFRAWASGFDRQYLYGSSMGGYAALTFAGALPGCVAISINPQTTLDKRLVPFETRFEAGWAEDWDGDFADAAVGARAASKCYVVYDPFLKPDKLHLERLDRGNLVELAVPLVGHGVPIWLQRMGALKPLVTGIVDGTLTRRSFKQLVAPRRKLAHYYVQMALHRKNEAFRQRCVHKALSLEPLHQDALHLLCQRLLLEKRYVEVLPIALGLLGETGKALACRAYFCLKQFDKVDELLLSAAAPGRPANPARLGQMTDLAFRLGRMDAGRTLLDALQRLARK